MDRKAHEKNISQESTDNKLDYGSSESVYWKTKKGICFQFFFCPDLKLSLTQDFSIECKICHTVYKFYTITLINVWLWRLPVWYEKKVIHWPKRTIILSVRTMQFAIVFSWNHCVNLITRANIWSTTRFQNFLILSQKGDSQTKMVTLANWYKIRKQGNHLSKQKKRRAILWST